jgi:hypothetical protein
MRLLLGLERRNIENPGIEALINRGSGVSRIAEVGCPAKDVTPSAPASRSAYVGGLQAETKSCLARSARRCILSAQAHFIAKSTSSLSQIGAIEIGKLAQSIKVKNGDQFSTNSD